MSVAVWWVRRDLRLADNQALARARASADVVVPVFVVDPALVESDRVADRRLRFLFDGLRALDTDLRARGSRLVVRHGRPTEALASVVAETGARVVVAEEDVSPFAVRRDRAVGQVLPLETVPGVMARPLGLVRKADGSGFVVFTPFSRAWRGLPALSASDLLPAPTSLPSPGAIVGEPIPVGPVQPGADGLPYPPGESAALRRLATFAGGGPAAAIYRYADDRDRPDLAATSGLSPYLRFGMLSARAAVVAASEAARAAPSAEARRSADTWLSELIWREFFASVLAEHPDVYRRSYREETRNLAWLDRADDLDAWRAGRTGYPLVDAGMRQLAATGWMHNRVRMVVASFLTKDLLVDWRLGEAHFMRTLVDGDPAANNGGWQWSAGTGTDAAPYFRVFNPTTQARRCDPSGAYIRAHVAELARVPDAYVHAPWEMPAAVQSASGCRIGQDYPAPIVDHAWARERALNAFARARDGAPRDRPIDAAPIARRQLDMTRAKP